jgi:hypothetical protein
LFASARLKVQWANHHIDQLKLGVQRYIEAHPDIISVERDVNLFQTNITVGRFAPITPDIVMLAGSVTQILRSALDHATSEILNGRNRTDHRTTFPVHETREGLIKSAHLGTINEASEKLAEVIRDEINPTKDRNYPVWGLNRLCNIDKHRNFILLTQLNGFRASSVIVPGQTSPCAFTFVGLRGQDDNKLYKIPLIEENSNVGPVLEILIGETEAFSNQELVPTLANCSNVSSKTLDAIERALA